MHTFVVLVIAVHKTIKQWLIVSGQFYLFMLWWIMVFFCILKWTKRRPVWYWNCWVWPHSLSKANQQIKNWHSTEITWSCCTQSKNYHVFLCCFVCESFFFFKEPHCWWVWNCNKRKGFLYALIKVLCSLFRSSFWIMIMVYEDKTVMRWTFWLIILRHLMLTAKIRNSGSY